MNRFRLVVLYIGRAVNVNQNRNRTKLKNGQELKDKYESDSSSSVLGLRSHRLRTRSAGGGGEDRGFQNRFARTPNLNTRVPRVSGVSTNTILITQSRYSHELPMLSIML
jgi:hypothetical protein